MTDRKPHHGRNIKRIREIQGIKQEALALELGEDWTQKKISMLETKESVDAELLAQVAKALRVTPEAIESFNEESVHNYINTFNDNSTGAFSNYNCSFNPIDKVVELYERMLKEKDEKIALLESNSKRQDK